VRSFNGTLFDHITGKLEDPGSLEFLARFSLGPPSKLDKTHCNEHLIANEPYITELEAAVMKVLPARLGNSLRLCEKPILGVGASGAVFAITSKAALAEVSVYCSVFMTVDPPC
jgi:hypothetical protein